jgi:sugar lactone lactonase YvrE
LYWIDVAGPSVNYFDPATGRNESWPMPEPIGAVALCEDDTLLVALQSGCYRYRGPLGPLELVAKPEPDCPENRLNDGRCDRAGRFWIGSMLDPPDASRATGRLHCVQPSGATRTWARDIFTSNGLAFSPDDRVLYHSDSHPRVRTIWAYDFDLDDGSISNRRVFVDTAGMPGRPDGGTVDEDGCYWSAANDGWSLVRYTPAGRVDRIIQVPVSKPSMPAFGGTDLKTLFFTSLRPPGLPVHDQPLAGSIFAVRLETGGIPEPRFSTSR